MVQSKPRGHFPHRRTVRFIVNNKTEDIDALKLVSSLLEYSGEIKGIVPLFRGKCFDITLATLEAAAKLAQEGADYENSHKLLHLLGRRSIHMSIFVSMEYPDKDLLALLATYGELKSRNVQCLHFSEQGFTHIENSIRVVEFNRIDHNIPKCVIVAGLEIGFKYSGQPVTCHRCHSTDHVVKDCPKRSGPHRRGDGHNPPPPRNNAGTGREGTGEDIEINTAPELFTHPTPSPTYAEAATSSITDKRKHHAGC